MTTELKPCPFCGGKAKLYGGPDAQESYSVWCEGGHRINGNFNMDETVAKWNTRAVPDVPELVSVGNGVFADGTGAIAKGEMIGFVGLGLEYKPDDDQRERHPVVRYDQAAAIITAERQRAEAAEAKLAEYEKQEPVAWQHAVTYPDGVKYIGVISKESKQQSRPLYASPAPYPDLKAENERLREALEYARGAVNDNERFTDVAQVIDIALSINSPS